ncbi:NAC domain-containing protein 83-like [Mercurialis annua]|uniref:NAC domain-containing protein 83-like n=1 Tax=Mercurialis annua TaxID=3986 RepID=UPI00215FEA8C|nr:NAC domain-containing protein 83-like [Mercurialis annua]
MSFLPPGCRFYPSDEQILCYYLRTKNRTNTGDERSNGYDLIKELDLYDYEPFDLPGDACYAYGYKGRKRHWFCYTKIRVLKERGRIRKGKGGYWRISGKVRDTVDPVGKAVIGTRSKFVFYLGDSVKNSTKTDWVLYEYALMHHAKASYVLCRIFVKSRGGNNVSENVLSCSAEESGSAVRHIGIQHNELLTPDIVEAKVHHHLVNLVDSTNDLSRCPVKFSTKLDDHVTRGSNCQSPYDIQLKFDSNKLVRTSGLPVSDTLKDAETSQQLASILEGDFIELDDLLD